MKNKKGQIPPQALAIGGLILFLVVGIPLIISALNSVSCTDEKNKIDNLNNRLTGLNNQLISYQEQVRDLEGQLKEKENISNQLEDCMKNLADLERDLNKCQSSRDSFSILWIDVPITRPLIILLNISLVISIVSIFNVLRWLLFSDNKKK